MLELRLYLDLYEREALAFIFGRTAIFFKQWETIPLRHFMHGVRAADGTSVAYPVAMSETNLIRSLKHLELKGIIDVRRHGAAATEYRIKEYDEINFDTVLAYMQREQPKQFKSIAGRHLAHPKVNRMNVLMEEARQISRNTYPNFGGTVTPNLEERVTPNLGEQNKGNISNKIFNTSSPNGERARRVVIPRKRNVL